MKPDDQGEPAAAAATNRRATEGRHTPIDVAERYKIAIAQHNHVADLRVRIVQGWWLAYVALAVAFGWLYSVSKPLTPAVPLIGIWLTFVMWSADIRNRHGLRDWRRIGASIEEEAKIPESQRYFAYVSTQEGVRHGRVIDIAAVAAILLLASLAIFLFRADGVLP